MDTTRTTSDTVAERETGTMLVPAECDVDIYRLAIQALPMEIRAEGIPTVADVESLLCGQTVIHDDPEGDHDHRRIVTTHTPQIGDYQGGGAYSAIVDLTRWQQLCDCQPNCVLDNLLPIGSADGPWLVGTVFLCRSADGALCAEYAWEPNAWTGNRPYTSSTRNGYGYATCPY